MSKIRVLWVHNFSPEVANSGIFMYQFYSYLRDHKSLDLDIHYSGPMFNIKNIVREIVRIRRLSKSYDIVHAQYGSVLSFVVKLALIGCRKRTALTLRGSDFYFNKGRNLSEFLHSTIATFFTRAIWRKYDDVFVVSARMKNQILKCSVYNKKHLHVMISPIDLEKFRITNFETRNRRRVLFGSVNINSANKRYDLAKSAIGELIKRGCDVEFLVAMDVSHHEMPSLINSIDVLLLTSSHEGWPNIVKEALATGVPFVATDVSDLKDVAKRSQGLCHVAQPDPVLLADALEKAIKYPRTFSNMEALRSLILDMSMESAARQLLGVYENQR